MEEAQFSALCNRVARQWRAWGESLEIETSEVSYDQVKAEIARGRDERPVGAAPTPGRGDVVSVSSPASAADSRSGGQRISVLAVDDDPVSLRLLTRHMRNESFEVTMAQSGRRGSGRRLWEKLDILVIDHEMLDQNGLEVIEVPDAEVGSDASCSSRHQRRAPDQGLRRRRGRLRPQAPAGVLCARIKAGVRIANLSRKIERDHNTIREKNAELNRSTEVHDRVPDDPLTGLNRRLHGPSRRRVEGLRAQRGTVRGDARHRPSR